MTDEKKNESCKSSCCCKSFCVGVLVGLVLTSAAFGITLATKCAVGACPMMGKSAKMCPVSQMQTQ